MLLDRSWLNHCTLFAVINGITTQRPAFPQSSPYEQLKAAAYAFSLLPLDASKEDVDVNFDQVRSLLLEVMMGALDSYPYQLSWNTLSRFGEAERVTLLDMEPGSPMYEAVLAHLKHLVASAMDYLP